MRGPTDAEVMRELHRIRKAVKKAFPRAEVDVTGVTNAHNVSGGWVITARRGNVIADHAMPFDGSVEKAIEALRPALRPKTKAS